jgi:hypothetical protein
MAFGEMAEIGVNTGARPFSKNEMPVSVLPGDSSVLLGDVFCKVIVKVSPEIAKLADVLTLLPAIVPLPVKMAVAFAAPLTPKEAKTKMIMTLKLRHGPTPFKCSWRV